MEEYEEVKKEYTCYHCGRLTTDWTVHKNKNGYTFKLCKECTEEGVFMCSKCGYTYMGEFATLVDGEWIYCKECSKWLKKCTSCGKLDDWTFKKNDLESTCSDCLPTNETFLKFKQDTVYYFLEGEEGQKILDWKKYWRHHFNSHVAEWYVLHMRKATYRKKPVAQGFSSMLSGYKLNSYEEMIREKEDKRFEELTDLLEDFFRKYILISCIGESRFAPSAARDGYDHLPSWVPVKDGGGNRENNWNYGFWMLNRGIHTEVDLAIDLVGIFELNWGESTAYGGAKWASIANHLMEYLAGSMSKVVFVDQAVSLCHNGSIFVDKLGVCIDDTKRILDLKFRAEEKDIPRLLSFMKRDNWKRYWYLSRRENDIY